MKGVGTQRRASREKLQRVSPIRGFRRALGMRFSLGNRNQRKREKSIDEEKCKDIRGGESFEELCENHPKITDNTKSFILDQGRVNDRNSGKNVKNKNMKKNLKHFKNPIQPKSKKMKKRIIKEMVPVARRSNSQRFTLTIRRP